MFHQYSKSIRCFHAVAKTGGFTAAAQYLHIGQPTVTDQVKALENRFGVELFYRGSRTIKLTDAGERLYAITRGLFGLEEEAIQFLQSAHKLKTGLVRVGAVSPPIALGLTKAFRHAHPSLDIKVSIGSEASVLHGIQDFDIDVGILAEPEPADGLHIVPYRTERIIAVLPEQHRLAQRSVITIHELEGEPVILRETGSKTRDRVERTFAGSQVPIHCTMEINSREAILHAVANGMGISFVTEIEYIPLPGLRAVIVEDDVLSIEYAICCLSERKDRPLIASLLDVASAKEKFP